MRLAKFAVAVGLAAAAHIGLAATIVLDDYSVPTPGQKIGDNNGTMDTAAAANVSLYATQRTLEHTLVSIIGQNTGLSSSIGVGAFEPNTPAEQLNMSNASGFDAVMGTSYILAAINASGPASLTFDVVVNDPGAGGAPNTVQFFFNGADRGTFNLVAAGATQFFSLTAADVMALSTAGDTVRFVFNGTPAWDVSLDNLELQIPEPFTLALVGVALLAAGATRRRVS